MTETKSIVGGIAFLILAFVGIYLVSTERHVAAIVVFALMGSLFGLFLWRGVFVSRRLIKKGDLAFVRKDFNGAKATYLSALKSKNWEGENPNDKDTAELYIKLALLQLSKGPIQLSEGPITSDVKFYLQKAITAYPKYCYKDMQKLALRFDVQLSREIFETFRKSELQHFEKLLSFPRQEDMVDAYFIAVGPPLSKSDTARGFLQHGTAIVRASVSPLPISAAVRNLEIQLRVIPNRMPSTRGLHTAFSSVEVQSLTDTAIEGIVTNTELRSSIINGIGKHLLYVVRSFLRFAKSRYMNDEVAELAIQLEEYMPVYWYEHAPGKKLDVLEELLEPSTIRRYYVHGWNYCLMAKLLFDINLEQVLKRTNISDAQLKALCYPQPAATQWQIIGNEVWKNQLIE